MKKAKKLAALLLAGVLAMGILVGCSGGGAGPLTKENVTDYIIDYYKAGMGVQLTEDAKLKSVADNILAYVNKEIIDGKYKGMTTQKAFRSIIGNAPAETRKGWLGTIEAGYDYSVSYVSIGDSYRTELFNQGKTAVTAYALMANQVMIYEIRPTDSDSTEQQEKSPTDGTIYIMECTVNGQSGMIAVFREPVTYQNGGGSGSSPAESEASSEVNAGA